jgi:hypothetical protein
MNKIAFIILLSVTTSIVFAQSREDMQKILQICIDQDDLQKYYHKQTVEGKQHLVIRDDGIVPAYLQVEKFGNPVLFLSLEQLFFWDIRDPLIFRKFNIAKDTANLEFECSGIKDVIKISFTKSNDGWLVKEKQIK